MPGCPDKECNKKVDKFIENTEETLYSKTGVKATLTEIKLAMKDFRVCIEKKLSRKAVIWVIVSILAIGGGVTTYAWGVLGEYKKQVNVNATNIQAQGENFTRLDASMKEVAKQQTEMLVQQAVDKRDILDAIEKIK